MADVLQKTFSNRLCRKKMLEISFNHLSCPYRCNLQYISTGSVDGLASNWWEAITWADVDQTLWRHMNKIILYLFCQDTTHCIHYDVIKWKHFPRYWPFVICEGNTPVIGGFPSQRPVACSFDVFFDLHFNKRLSIQLRRRWLETPSQSLLRHSNDKPTNCFIVSSI